MRTLSLLSSTVLPAAVLTACDSEVTEPPFLPETSPTPAEVATATATPEPTATTIPADLEGFRAFAVHVEEVVVVLVANAEGDANTIVVRALDLQAELAVHHCEPPS